MHESASQPTPPPSEDTVSVSSVCCMAGSQQKFPGQLFKWRLTEGASELRDRQTMISHCMKQYVCVWGTEKKLLHPKNGILHERENDFDYVYEYYNHVFTIFRSSYYYWFSHPLMKLVPEPSLMEKVSHLFRTFNEASYTLFRFGEERTLFSRLCVTSKATSNKFSCPTSIWLAAGERAIETASHPITHLQHNQWHILLLIISIQCFVCERNLSN